MFVASCIGFQLVVFVSFVSFCERCQLNKKIQISKINAVRSRMHRWYQSTRTSTEYVPVRTSCAVPVQIPYVVLYLYCIVFSLSLSLSDANCRRFRKKRDVFAMHSTFRKKIRNDGPSTKQQALTGLKSCLARSVTKISFVIVTRSLTILTKKV